MYDPMLLERIPQKVLEAANLVAQWFHEQNQTGSICGIGPVDAFYEVGRAATMPGVPSFTIGVFNQLDVPLGSKLYIAT